MISFGPGIFWTSLAAVAAVLSLATLIGRAWSRAFPYKLQALAGFYLAPVLGLATLTIIASLAGRFVPLGNAIAIPLMTVSLLVYLLIRERHAGQALYHVLMVSVFGIACGASMLGPLFVDGGFNSHNDAFTYLTHGRWLQDHAFGDAIPDDQITPQNTQIALYQQAGLRMGASFLLALFQSLLNLRWSYEVYPAVVIAAIAVCCLAIGFPLARTLRSMRRGVRLALLAFPAFSLGGLVFGANLGFMPQVVGMAMGAGLLFMLGPVYRWIAVAELRWPSMAKTAFPGAALLAGMIFSYSEIAPFMLAAVFGSGFLMAFRFRAWKKTLVFGAALAGIAGVLLNTELARTYAALRGQASVVVGSPVDWSPLGYLAHAFGVHGGAWDGYQWTSPGKTGPLSYGAGLALVALIAGLCLARMRLVWRATIDGPLMPAAAALAVFTAGILYFRYAVPSPFPKGMGQSWSQFKLADWAHPFAVALVLMVAAGLRPRRGNLSGKWFDGAVMTFFAVGMISAAWIGVARTRPFMDYYSGVKNMDRFYLEFRNTVLAACPSDATIYLALGGEHHKFRQMAMVYLYDRAVASDWTDDGYIYPRLLEKRRKQELAAGSCVVEPMGDNSWLKQSTPIGPFRIGIFDGRGLVKITSVTGAHDRESDGKNWWHWVERKASFMLQPEFVAGNMTKTHLRFEYATRGKQNLTLRVAQRDGTIKENIIPSDGGASVTFEAILDTPPADLAEMSIETDGAASPLGGGDPRMAAWTVRNVSIDPVSP